MGEPTRCHEHLHSKGCWSPRSGRSSELPVHTCGCISSWACAGVSVWWPAERSRWHGVTVGMTEVVAAPQIVATSEAGVAVGRGHAICMFTVVRSCVCHCAAPPPGEQAGARPARTPRARRARSVVRRIPRPQKPPWIHEPAAPPSHAFPPNWFTLESPGTHLSLRSHGRRSVFGSWVLTHTSKVRPCA